MSHARLSLGVAIATFCYLAGSFLLGDRPAAAMEWVRFTLMGAAFALLFALGSMLVRRFLMRGSARRDADLS